MTRHDKNGKTGKDRLEPIFQERIVGDDQKIINAPSFLGNPAVTSVVNSAPSPVLSRLTGQSILLPGEQLGRRQAGG